MELVTVAILESPGGGRLYWNENTSAATGQAKIMTLPSKEADESQTAPTAAHHLLHMHNREHSHSLHDSLVW